MGFGGGGSPPKKRLKRGGHPKKNGGKWGGHAKYFSSCRDVLLLNKTTDIYRNKQKVYKCIKNFCSTFSSTTTIFKARKLSLKDSLSG